MEKSLSASVDHDRQGLNGFRCFGGDTETGAEMVWTCPVEAQ